MATRRPPVRSGGLDRFRDRLLDAAFPSRCAGCRAEGPPLCATCGRALDARLDLPPGIPLGLPGDIPAPLLQLDWCAPFRGVVRDALHGLKYGGERRLAEPLGQAVARRWAMAGRGGDLLVHVPVHRDRERRRGYDQAAWIARAAAGHLGLPWAPALTRQRATTAQFDLDRELRASNVAGAFAVLDREASVAGRWVVLVDDVMTTGATLSACAVALLQAGAVAVSAITVARER